MWSEANVARLAVAAEVLSAVGPDDDRADALYREWYAAPAGPVEDVDPWAAPVAGVLRAAHSAARQWSPASDVVAVGVAGTVVVQPPRRALCRGEYATASGVPGIVPVRGSTVRMLDRRGGQVHDGWWRTWGSGWRGEASLAAGVTRIYFATVTSEVARLTHSVTSVLGACTGEWAFKVGIHPTTLARADGAVVYVRDVSAHEVIERIGRQARPFVRTGCPAFAAPVVPGIAWSQDPGDGQSFGESRCALVARGFSEWVDGAGQFADSVEAVFERAGLDPARPQLRARKVVDR